MTQQFEDEDFEDDSPLIKQLRKQLKDQKKELDEAREAREKSDAALQKFQVRDVLKDRNISDARATKYLLADKVDLADEAAVDKWLEENGDLFGYQKKATETEEQTQNAFQQMSATESLGSQDGRVHPAITALEGTDKPEDVLNILMGKYGNVRISE